MPSVADIIRNALLDINKMGAGEPAPADEDTELALSHYNRLIDRWRALGRMSYFEFSQSFPFAASQQSYTLGIAGSGANFIITGAGAGVRPPVINRAKLVLSGNTEIDLPLIYVREYQSIPNPAQSGQPMALYYKPTFPNGTLYPVPYPTSVTDELKLYFGSQLAPVATGEITTNIDMPPALEDAITWTLEERLCIAFQKPLTNELKAQAHGARQVYSQLNDADPPFIGTALRGEGGSSTLTTYDGR